MRSWIQQSLISELKKFFTLAYSHWTHSDQGQSAYSQAICHTQQRGPRSSSRRTSLQGAEETGEQSLNSKTAHIRSKKFPWESEGNSLLEVCRESKAQVNWETILHLTRETQWANLSLCSGHWREIQSQRRKWDDENKYVGILSRTSERSPSSSLRKSSHNQTAQWYHHELEWRKAHDWLMGDLKDFEESPQLCLEETSD